MRPRPKWSLFTLHTPHPFSASAVAATDFNIVSMNISFAEGSLDGDTLCIVVPITDDMALNENINFTVSLIVTAAGDAMVENAITTVTIVNDDGKKTFIWMLIYLLLLSSCNSVHPIHGECW